MASVVITLTHSQNMMEDFIHFIWFKCESLKLDSGVP